jgi:two-component system, sensor histidine kinase RpfC
MQTTEAMEKLDDLSRWKPLRWMLGRFRNRPDTEHEQSLVRVAIVIIVLVYLSLMALFGQPTESARHGLIVLGLFLVFSLVMVGAIAVNPGVSITRRILCMFGDMGMISYLLYYYGETMTPLYVVYLWVSSGYGLRYGNRYLAASTSLAAIGFLLVLQYNPDWQAHATTGWGLWIGLIVLPMYIASLLAKLSRALAAAESANQAKSRFLANMSHEIRTPINGVIGLLELVSATPLKKQQRSLIQGAQSATATLLHLINNVLDISKIEAGQVLVSQTPFDLHALVNDTVRLFRYAAKAKGIVLQRGIDPDLPYRLTGDELHIRQVLVNLLGNAVKFTEKGSVRVSVEGCPAPADRVGLRFIVTDTGIGISEEAQCYIFEPFRQEDESITRRFGGTGLGMSIARQLVEIMGGSISLQSTVGQGSSFTVELSCGVSQQVQELTRLHFSSDIRLISRDSSLIGQLRSWLGEWGVGMTVDIGTQSLGNAVAFDEHLLLDEDCLDDPLTLFARYPDLLSRDVILLTRKTGHSRDELVQAGFVACVTLPLVRQRLHSLLHSLQDVSFEQTSALQHVVPRDSTALPARSGDILVAEDNATNQEVTRSFLQQDNHRVTLVSDGEEALDALESTKFDLAIVDMMMPGCGGLDVIKLYRHLQGARDDMPFIVLTANVSDEARHACEELGVGYLTKPLRGRDLKSAVQQALAGQAVDVSQPRDEETTGGEEILDEEKYREVAALMGDQARMQMVIENFCKDSEALLKQMHEFEDAGQWQELGDLAHALKGSAAAVGAKRLQILARDLEVCVHGLQPATAVADLQDALRDAYQETRTALLDKTARAADLCGLAEQGLSIDR